VVTKALKPGEKVMFFPARCAAGSRRHGPRLSKEDRAYSVCFFFSNLLTHDASLFVAGEIGTGVNAQHGQQRENLDWLHGRRHQWGDIRRHVGGTPEDYIHQQGAPPFTTALQGCRALPLNNYVRANPHALHEEN